MSSQSSTSDAAEFLPRPELDNSDLKHLTSDELYRELAEALGRCNAVEALMRNTMDWEERMPLRVERNLWDARYTAVTKAILQRGAEWDKRVQKKIDEAEAVRKTPIEDVMRSIREKSRAVAEEKLAAEKESQRKTATIDQEMVNMEESAGNMSLIANPATMMTENVAASNPNHVVQITTGSERKELEDKYVSVNSAAIAMEEAAIAKPPRRQRASEIIRAVKAEIASKRSPSQFKSSEAVTAPNKSSELAVLKTNGAQTISSPLDQLPCAVMEADDVSDHNDVLYEDSCGDVSSGLHPNVQCRGVQTLESGASVDPIHNLPLKEDATFQCRGVQELESGTLVYPTRYLSLKGDATGAQSLVEPVVGIESPKDPQMSHFHSKTLIRRVEIPAMPPTPDMGVTASDDTVIPAPKNGHAIAGPLMLGAGLALPLIGYFVWSTCKNKKTCTRSHARQWNIANES